MELASRPDSSVCDYLVAWHALLGFRALMVPQRSVTGRV
jgi:hypothetical protein